MPASFVKYQSEQDVDHFFCQWTVDNVRTMNLVTPCQKKRTTFVYVQSNQYEIERGGDRPCANLRPMLILNAVQSTCSKISFMRLLLV